MLACSLLTSLWMRAIVGSMYAMMLIEAGFDVTLFAHSNRFKSLRENGLQYKHRGTVRSIQVNVIDTLENGDIYDFIFVTVRYDRAGESLRESMMQKNRCRTFRRREHPAPALRLICIKGHRSSKKEFVYLLFSAAASHNP